MKNTKTNKPNLVTLSLEELKAISGGATTTLDEEGLKAPKLSEDRQKSSSLSEEFKKA